MQGGCLLQYCCSTGNTIVFVTSSCVSPTFFVLFFVLSKKLFFFKRVMLLRSSRLLSFSPGRTRFVIGRGLKCLVVAEQDGSGGVSAGTLAAVTAGRQVGCDEGLTMLVCDTERDSFPKVVGVDKVVRTGLKPSAKSLAAYVRAEKFTHAFGGSSSGTKELMPRLAVALGVSPLMDIIEVLDASTFRRNMYAGNAIATVTASGGGPVVATTRTTAFEKAEVLKDDMKAEAIKDLEADPKACVVLSSAAKTSSSKKADLVTAKTVVSGGRGMKAGEHFALLDDLASKFTDAAVGASRAAVDAGMVPNELQVGQTGKVVTPNLYVAVGISGAIQHLSGMKESKVIVAVNKDPEAPIFQVADYGLVADLFKAVPELTNKL